MKKQEKEKQHDSPESQKLKIARERLEQSPLKLFLQKVETRNDPKSATISMP